MQYLLGPQRTAAFLLIAEVIIFLGLLYGAYLMRRRRKLRAHHWTQSVIVLLNLALVLGVMSIGFYRYVLQGGAAAPAVSRLMIGHAAAGTIAQLAAIYLLVSTSDFLPKRLRMDASGLMMRGTLALWTLVAISGFGVYYSQYIAPATSSDQDTTSTPAATATDIGPGGLAAWADGDAVTDRVTLMAVNLPPPAPGAVYQGWLLSQQSGFFVSLGVIDAHPDGSALVEYLSPDGANLLALYDQVLVTLEDAPAGKSGPSAKIVLSGEIGTEVGVHLRHLLAEGPGLIDSLGLATALDFHAAHLSIHARETELAWRRGNLASMKRHAEHIINLVEGQSGANYGDLNEDGSTQDPGDGVGLLAYARLVSEHAQLALDSPDATPAVAIHAPHVSSMVENVTGWATQVRDDALAIIAATSPDVAVAQTDHAVSLSGRALAGFDENSDGEVSPISGEGGAAQIGTHVRAMAELALHPGPGAPAANLRPLPPPSPRVTPTPPSGAQTTTVLMPGLFFRDKTIAVSRGAIVVWVNNNESAHTVTADDGRFKSGNMRKGNVFSVTFNDTGRFPYYCEYHGDKGGIGMAGLVIVE